MRVVTTLIVFLCAMAFVLAQSVQEWVPAHVTKQGKFIAGHFVTHKVRKPPIKSVASLDHWVPGHTQKDGKFVPGHMVKGRAPALPKTGISPPRTKAPDRQAPPTVGVIDRVFVTRTGKTYHRENCPHVKGRSTTTSMSLSEARDKGYKPCKTCNPPE